MASARPMRPLNVRSSSSVQQHQNYLSTAAPKPIGLPSAEPATTPKRFHGVPSPEHPPTIVNGIDHNFSTAPGQRIIATLFYTDEEITGAPTTDTPREPDDHERLDHLYGSYVSPLCITAFLTMMSSLSTLDSTSHRCLDSPTHPRVVEVTLPHPTYLSLDDLRRHEYVYRFSQEWHVDVVLQHDAVCRRYPRFVAFDMDSTLIREEVIDLIAASIGVEDQVSQITARAMNGELDFAASLRERVGLLKGVDANIFVKLRDVITPTPGARELVRALKRLGVTTAVFSGGFIPTTQWLADQLGLDFAFANTLAAADGVLTGAIEGTIVDAARKRDLLLEIAGRQHIHLAQTVAVGDGANDLLMMGAAGLGVAFRAKPRVQLAADVRLNGSLLDLLYVFGLTHDEIMALLE